VLALGHRKTSIAPAAASTSASADDVTVLAADEPPLLLESNGLPPPLWSLRLVCELSDDEDVGKAVDCTDGAALVSTTKLVAVLEACDDVLANEGVADGSVVEDAELLEEDIELLAAATLEEVADVDVVLAAVAGGLDVDCP
jgi:hypothetical protein